MICLTDGGSLWIGNSADGTNLDALKIRAVLNVAHDLKGSVGWPEVEYNQVGLVDGPGNPQTAYCGAVLVLDSLIHRRKKTLVCCHTGSRSLAVSVMYLEMFTPRGWDGWIDILQERVGIDLPVPHPAHREAFDRMNWRSMAKIVGDGK